MRGGTELDYARVLDPGSRIFGSEDVVSKIFKGLAVGAGVCGASCAVSILLYRHLRHRQHGLKPTPEDAVKVAILGTGWGVKVQVPVFRHAGLSIVSVYSRNPHRAAALAEQYHIARGEADVQQAVSSPDVELVSVVTPPAHHCENFLCASQVGFPQLEMAARVRTLSIYPQPGYSPESSSILLDSMAASTASWLAAGALQAGKHVVVDKPMALNAQEGLQMLEAARQHPGQVALVDHELRFSPMLLQAQRHLQSGALGRVLYVQAVWLQQMPVRVWDWWASRAEGGGAMMSMCPHVVDALRFLLEAEVSYVAAHLQTSASPLMDRATGEHRQPTSDDVATLHLELCPQSSTASPVWGAKPSAPAPLNATVTVGAAGSGRDTSLFVIRGERGSIQMDALTASMQAYNERGKVVTQVRPSQNNAAVLGTLQLGRSLQSALGPLQDRSALQPAASIADGLAVLEVFDAARTSSQQGGVKVKVVVKR